MLRRQKEWFNVGLPDYLQPKYKIPDPLLHYDETVISEIAKKMAFPLENVRYALADKENNQIKVAYQLTVDSKRVLAGMGIAGEQRVKAVGQIQKLPSKLAPAPEEHKHTVHIPEHLLSRVFKPTCLSETADNQAAQAPIKTRKSKTRWHFGIRSRSPPFDIMLEIYRALKNCGMQWKPIDAFHIRCRHVTAAGQVVKLDIQLYKVESNNYLVDFKNATPSNVDPNGIYIYIDNVDVR
ncbi:protein kinase, AMP-activated, alpha 2 catalytic subunit [Phlyctochytrium planicorne]|nr:protein kinase, AMP-activated, alpha 2 catalytic subunit [Phlyctochytrium planicorne]